MRSRVNALSVVVLLTAGAGGALSCWAETEAGRGNDRTRSDGGDVRQESDPADGAATRAAHVAITNLAFFSTPEGPRTLVRGVHPPRAGLVLHVELLDGAGEPAVLDLDGSGNSPPSVFEIAIPAADGPAFFDVIESAPGIERHVNAIAVTARDTSGKAGERYLAVLGQRAVRANGETCDAQGFDACPSGSVCAPFELGAPSRCEPAAASPGSPAVDERATLGNDADDVPPLSRVVLHDVAPGGYVVVVDALTPEDTFPLRTTAR